MAKKSTFVADKRNIEASIKYHLLQRKAWNVNDVLAIICAIIYPFRSNYDIFSAGNIDRIKYFLCDYDVEVNRLSFEGVKEFFKHNILPQMATQNKTCLRSILDDKKFKYDRENGVITINYEDTIIKKLLDTYKDRAYLYDGYGSESYVPNDDAEQNIVASTNNLSEPTGVTPDESINSIIDITVEELPEINLDVAEGEDENITKEEELVLKQSKEENNTNRKKTRRPNKISDELLSPFIYIYKELNCKRGEEINYQYIWQWRISNEEYSSIKNLLIANKGNVSKLLKSNNVHVIFIIVTYIAEFFKREWNGHVGETTALESIGLENKAQDIAEKYYGSKLQQIVYSDKNNRWLDALYLEGGLPIKYIVNSANDENKQGGNRGKYLKIFSDLYKHPDKAASKLASDIKQKSIQYSYENEGSIYHFIQSIKDPNVGLQNTFNNVDLGLEPFRTLSKLLNEGVENFRKEPKFRIKYRVWKYMDEFVVRRSIVMRENAAYCEVPANIISLNRIRNQWKIDNEPYSFWLCVKVNDKNCGKMFHYVTSKQNRVDGKLYRNDDGDIERILPPLTSINDKVEVCYLNSNRSEEKIILQLNQNFKNKGYIELRQVGPFEWIDRSNARDNYELAAVLFDATCWKVHSVDGLDKYDQLQPIDGLGWEEFSDNLVLKSLDGSKEKTIFNTTNRIFVSVSDKSIHSIAKKSYVSMASNGHIDLIDTKGEHTTAVLVKEPVEFIAVDDENNDASDRITNVEYRDPNNMSTFEEYPKNGTSKLKLGYIIFRVTTNNGNTRHIKHCYILPEKADIHRCCQEKEKGVITLSNFGCKEINGRPIAENEYFDLHDTYCNDSNSSYNDITISDGEYRYTIQVARPFNRRDRLKRGVIDTHNRVIPILFRKEYQVRVIDDEGVTYIDPISVDGIQKLSDYLYQWFRDKKYPIKRNSIEVEKISYNVYTKEIGYDRDMKYYVDSGVSIDKTGLKFCFLSLKDNNLHDIKLEEKYKKDGGKVITYLTLSMDEYSEENGIIMQCSSQDPFRCYRPRYKPASSENSIDSKDKIEARNSRLKEYAKNLDIARDECTYKHFDAVCECGGYFGAMDRLLSLSLTYKNADKSKKGKNQGIISNEDKLTNFYIGYYEYCKNNNRKPNYDGLWRMAEEFRFDWLLIPRNIWKACAITEETKMGVIALFRHIPNSSRNYAKLFDDYWNLKIQKVRDTNKPYRFLKHIFTDDRVEDIMFPDVKKLYEMLDKYKYNK